MASRTATSASSWKDLPYSEAVQQHKIENLRFSPSGKWAISAEDSGSSKMIRFLNMITGDLKTYTCTEETDGTIVESYFVNDHFVSLVFISTLNDRILLDIRQYSVDHESKELTFEESCGFHSSFPASYQLDGVLDCWNEGINKIEIQGLEFAVLSLDGALVLMPWDVRNHSIVTMFSLGFQMFEGLYITKFPTTFGSQLFFPLYDVISSEATGDMFQRYHTDKLLCIDLSNLNVNEKRHELSEVAENVSVIDFKKLGSYPSTSTKVVILHRCGRYLIAYEEKRDSSRRPTSNKSIFIWDLEMRTSQRMEARYTKDAQVTITRNSIFIWRNVTRCKDTTVQFKFVTIPTRVPSLIEAVSRKLLLTNPPIEDMKTYICRILF